MDVKDLNKSQLILLTLLVSFVTSIATGIATVTLLQEVPSPVSQTINRIVQKTIDTVTPAGEPNTQTIIIKEEDLIVDAVDKYSKNRVSIKAIDKDFPLSDAENSVTGHGFVFSGDGIVAVDIDAAPFKGDYVVIAGDKNFKAQWLGSDAKMSLAFLKIVPGQKDANAVGFITPNFAQILKMRIGQKLIVLGDPISLGTLIGFKDIKISSAEKPAVEIAQPGTNGTTPAGQTASVVEALPKAQEAQPALYFKTLLSSVSITKAYAGSAVSNLDGEISGFVVSRGGEMTILSSQAVLQKMQEISAVKTP